MKGKLKYPRAKKGLGFIISGIILTVVASVLLSFATFVRALSTVSEIITIVAGVAELIGIILCFASKSKYFKRAFFIVLVAILVPIALVIVGATVAMPAWLIVVLLVLPQLLSLLADVNIIKGCGEVTEDNKVIGHAKLVISFLTSSIVINVVVFVLAAIPATAKLTTLLGILGAVSAGLRILYCVFYLILLFRSHRNVK